MGTRPGLTFHPGPMCFISSRPRTRVGSGRAPCRPVEASALRAVPANHVKANPGEVYGGPAARGTAGACRSGRLRSNNPLAASGRTRRRARRAVHPRTGRPGVPGSHSGRGRPTPRWSGAGGRRGRDHAVKAGTPVVVEPPAGLFHIDFRSLWEYRELLYFLVWRDLKVRYKQTAIGIGWAVLQPLTAMAIFTVVFGRFARVPSDGLPYPVFAYCALLPWNYFASALNRAILSVVGEAHLISKIYFPRLLLPLAGPISGMVDFAVPFVLLIGMMAWYRIPLSWAVLTVPLFYTIPFLVQILFFATPVVYPLSLVPEKYRLLYSLNPMVGVVGGFRWALLGQARPEPGGLAATGAGG